MSKVVREDIDNLNATVTITIAKEDYQSKFKSELNKYRNKAQMKGFRKGKTPIGFIKKMYGQTLLVDVINETLEKNLNDYLKKEEIDILGQPLPSEKQGKLDFDANNLKDFVFHFDLGLTPKFEVQGLSKDTSFDKYKVEIADETIAKDLEAARSKGGDSKPVDDVIEDKDIVDINAEELEGDVKKENGWASTFKVFIGDNLVNDFKNQLIGKKKGDVIRFNISEVEEGKDGEYARKYLLKVEAADETTVIGDQFEGTIAEVSRLSPAELNQDFFDKMFGEGNVKSEEEAREKIKESINQHYDQQAESLLFRDFQDKLMDLNDLKLPNAFLKRWLKVSNENVSLDQIEKEYNDFAENLKWSLIKGKIVKNLSIEVSDDDIFEGFKSRVRNYFGGGMDELVVLNTANRLMDDKDQVNQMYQEMVADKIFVGIKDIVTIKDSMIDADKFDAVIQEARDEATAKMEAAKAAKEVSQTEEIEDAEVIEDVEQA